MNARLMLWLSLLLTLCFGTVPLQARYLNPNTGRFQTMDSYEGSQSEPASLHKYLYVHGNPVNGVDPSGHDFTVSSSLSGASISGGLNISKAGAGAKVRWELRQLYREIANDFNPRDLRQNQALGFEGEVVWVEYLREKGFRANRSGRAVSANGPDIFATRFEGGRLEIVIGEVKSTSAGFAGIGSLRWSVLNHYRQMSYRWIDRHASSVVDQLVSLGINGIDRFGVQTLLENGEVDLYLLAAIKRRECWELKGFRMLHVGFDDLEMSDFGHPEITGGATRSLSIRP